MTAKQKCIAHWERLKRARSPFGHEQPHSDQCAFCLANPRGCNKCPIKIKTGHSHCVGSPFDDAEEAWRNWRIALRTLEQTLPFEADSSPTLVFLTGVVERKKNCWQHAAQAMIDFLESLP